MKMFAWHLYSIEQHHTCPACMQVSRIELALANGSLLELTPQSNPHLFRAAQVTHS